MEKNPMVHFAWVMLGGSLLTLLFFAVYALSLAGWGALAIIAFGCCSWVVGRSVWRSWEREQ